MQRTAVTVSDRPTSRIAPDPSHITAAPSRIIKGTAITAYIVTATTPMTIRAPVAHGIITSISRQLIAVTGIPVTTIHHWAAIIGTTAMFIAQSLPVSPSVLASDGGCPRRDAGVVAGGSVVMVLLPSLMPGRGSGDVSGDEDEKAAAVTTDALVTITISQGPPSTMPFPAHDHTSSSSWAILINNGNVRAIIADASSLLHILMSMIDGSHSISGCGCEGVSGFPRNEVSCITTHARPPPTVVRAESAWRGGDCPAVSAMVHMAAAPPRPGPPGLLSSSTQPQPGRVPQRGGRVGAFPCAAG